MDIKIRKPFFMFNPKSYLYGDNLLKLAKEADQLAAKYKDKITIFVTGPYVDLKTIADQTDHIIVTSQAMSSIELGRGMGYITAESLYNAGVRATFLNHAENPLTLSDLAKTIERAKANNIKTVVCADSIVEAKLIANLDPDIILCEPTELIGTGKVSDESYIKKTNDAIRSVNESILVMQAAGISTADDVYRTIALGADGTGCTSGIVKADDPSRNLRKMVEACIRAVKEKEN